MLQPENEVVEVFVGDSLEQAMAFAVASLGPDLVVRRARKVRKGMPGLVGRDRYEVVAAPSAAAASPADAVGSAFDALLSRAEEHEQAPRVRRTTRPPTELPHPAPTLAEHVARRDVPRPTHSTPEEVFDILEFDDFTPTPARRPRSIPAPRPAGLAVRDVPAPRARPLAGAAPAGAAAAVQAAAKSPAKAPTKAVPKAPAGAPAKARKAPAKGAGKAPAKGARKAPAKVKAAPEAPAAAPAAAPQRPGPAKGSTRRSAVVGRGWSRQALEELGLPPRVLAALPDDAPTDDLAWTVALAQALETVLRAPATLSAGHPLVVHGLGLAGALGLLDAAARGLTPGTITSGDRTAPATATELALVVRAALVG